MEVEPEPHAAPEPRDDPPGPGETTKTTAAAAEPGAAIVGGLVQPWPWIRSTATGKTAPRLDGRAAEPCADIVVGTGDTTLRLDGARHSLSTEAPRLLGPYSGQYSRLE